MNSSLTNREVYVNQYVAKQRDNGFLIRGLTPFTLGRKFSLRRIKTGTWSLSGTVLNGKRNRVRKRFHALGLEEAVHEAEQILYGRAAESTDDLLIPDCFSKWMNTLSIRPDTMRNYRTHTNFFLDWCESEGISYWRDLRLEHLEAYAQSLVEAKKKPRTIKLYTQPIRTAARWASQNWPERYRDFGAGFRLPRPSGEILVDDPNQRATLSFREVGKFLVFLGTIRAGERLIAGIALQALCGLRVREVYRLRWDNIDLDKGLVTVEGQVKNQHSVRRLPLPALAVRVLASVKPKGPHVISDYANDNQYSIAVKTAIKKWRSGLNLEPRGLRRTLPSTGVKEGWHNYALERYLGHSPKTITEKHYVLPSQEELLDLLRDEVAKRIDARLSAFLKVWQQNGKR